MLITNPALSNADAHSLHSRKGGSLGRPTLRRYKSNHAPPRPVPGTPVRGLPPGPQAIANRAYTHLVGTTWKNTLTGPQQAAWNALAALVTVKNDAGTPLALNGRELFCWYCLENFATDWWNDTQQWPQFVPAEHDTPPTWSPPAVPSSPTSSFAYSHGQAIIAFPDLSTGATRQIVGLVPYYLDHQSKYGGSPSQRVFAVQAPDGSLPPLLNIVIIAEGFTPDTWQISGKTCTFRLLSDAPDYVPSDPFHVTIA